MHKKSTKLRRIVDWHSRVWLFMCTITAEVSAHILPLSRTINPLSNVLILDHQRTILNIGVGIWYRPFGSGNTEGSASHAYVSGIRSSSLAIASSHVMIFPEYDAIRSKISLIVNNHAILCISYLSPPALISTKNSS